MVTKDRFGAWPQGEVAAEADVAPLDEGATMVLDLFEPAVTARSGKALRPTCLMERVSRYVEQNPDASKNDIEKNVVGNDKAIRKARQILVHEQYIAVVPDGQAHVHRSVRSYREDEDHQCEDLGRPRWNDRGMASAYPPSASALGLGISNRGTEGDRGAREARP